MDKKKIIKILSILGVVVGAILLVWFIVIYPLIDFNKKEKQLETAAKEYYEKNPHLRPEEGELSVVTLKTLLNQKYISTLKSTYDRKYCDDTASWVKVRRKEGKYDYYVNLDCGSMKSNVDHDGPVIKLKGKDEIEIEKGSTYEDEGVASVYDDTDGKMEIDSVDIENNVNTKKIGTYTVTYAAYDSLKNKTVVERTIKVVQTLDKLVKTGTDKDNLYKGNVDNNYIEFSNMLFRIVGLNEDGSVKIVSAEPVGTVNYDDINKWLNEYFYEHLTDNAKKYVVEQEFCSSKIEANNTSNTTNCDKKTKQKVGVLSIKDYNNSLVDNKSSLYNNNYAWTSDYNDNSNSWIAGFMLPSQGEAINHYLSMKKEYNLVVYPVVNLKKGIKITKGIGTMENPYIFSKVKAASAGDLINTRYTGEYVSYKGTTYRIIDGNVDGNTKIVSTSLIPELSSVFSESNEVVYNPKTKGNVGYYIENEVGKTVKTDIFTKKEIEVPIYSKNATYSGKKTIKKYKVKLSAPNMYEMFSSALNATNQTYWLINSSKQENTNYMITYGDYVSYENVSIAETAGIRIVGYLDEGVTILSGKGTQIEPYILEK